MSARGRDRLSLERIPRDGSREGRMLSALQSDDPKYLNCRVFVGNLPTDKMDKDEFEEKFSKYGPIIACSLHKGFGFVQYERELDALEAIRNEQGGLYKGFKIDCNMAAERRRDERRPRRRTPPPFDDKGRERLGGRLDRYDYYARDYPSHRDRSPHADRIRDREPFDSRFRDSFREDPRRDPYGDSFRDPYLRNEPELRRPSDAEILVVNKQHRGYAEVIEHRLKNFGLYVELRILLEDVSLAQALEDVSRRGCLYAIVVTSQHELHRSVTLNILHGTPQEHRNMPLEDALNLVARNFDSYLISSREKGKPGVPVKEHSMATLLHLLADNRQLTISELDKIIRVLENRRDRLIEAEGGIPPSLDKNLKQDAETKGILQQQQELQQKILSILNPGGQNIGMPIQNQSKPGMVAPPNPNLNPWQKASASSQQSSAINFDNPNIQKALDNLIQSGPNLLRNIQSGSHPNQNNVPMSAPLLGGGGILSNQREPPFNNQMPHHGGLMNRPMHGRHF